MYNKFCPKLSNRIFFTNVDTDNDVQFKPCCWFEPGFSVNSKEDLDQKREELSKITDWTPSCWRCKQDEDAGLASIRQATGFIKNVKPNEISLELQLSKECNAACITCGPWSSTTWSKYNQKIQGRSTRFDIKKDNSVNVEKIKRVIDFTKVKHVTVAGGEPLMDTLHIEVLSSIPDDSKSSVALDIITNGSFRLTQPQIEFYKKFKLVQFIFSIDGVGKVFDYHRWPLLWHQVESNIEHFISLSTDCPNFQFGITPTLTPLNIFYLDQVESWISFLEVKYSKQIFLRLAGASGVMSLASLSPNLRKILHEKYQDHDRIKKFIELEKFDIKSHIRFAKHLKYHDKHRKLEWTATFSEIADHVLISKSLNCLS